MIMHEFNKIMTVRSWLLTQKITPYNCRPMQSCFMDKICALQYDERTETFMGTRELTEQDWATIDFLHEQIQRWIQLDRKLKEMDKGGLHGA